MLRNSKLAVCWISGLACFAAVTFAGTGRADEEATVDYKALENPVKFTTSSISRGKVLYSRLCAECHGPDGKAQVDIVANATNLTEPARYHSGTTVGEVYRSIKLGAGDSMPPFKTQLKKEDDIWHLVNFIQNLWPEDRRPKLEDEEKTDSESESKE